MSTSDPARNLGDTLAGGSSNIALVDLSEGDKEYSYDELDAAISSASTAMEFQRGDRVGLLGANSAAFVVTLFALMRSGAVAVPVNTKFTNDVRQV